MDLMACIKKHEDKITDVAKELLEEVKLRAAEFSHEYYNAVSATTFHEIITALWIENLFFALDLDHICEKTGYSEAEIKKRSENLRLALTRYLDSVYVNKEAALFGIINPDDDIKP